MALARWSALILIVIAVPVAAATFTVGTTLDTTDASPGDGVCATAAGSCSLRAAVQEANARPGADTIVLPSGTYTLSLAGAAEEQAATGDLDVRDPLTILGAATATTVISGGGLDRIFDLHVGIELHRVTLRDGAAPAASGGAMRLNAIPAQAFVELIDVRLTNNTAANGGALAIGASPETYVRVRGTTFDANTATIRGGALHTAGATASLRIEHSRFEGNTAPGGGGAVSLNGRLPLSDAMIVRSTFEANTTAGRGGAIYAEAFNSRFFVGESTFVRNAAANGGAIHACCDSGAFGFLAGLMSLDLGVSSSTFSANRATAAGGAVFATATVSVVASTLAGNEAPAGASLFGQNVIVPPALVASAAVSAGPNCGGSVRTYHSVVSDASCTAAPGSENWFNTDPLLGPLADHGGPTLTHHPLPGSPVIDRVPLLITRDQRGAPRPAGAASDAGSVEVISPAAAAATSATLAAFPTRVVAGQPVTLTATVPQFDNARVTFRDGATLLGHAHQSSINPATLVLATLAPGIHTITATFEGNPGFAPSVSEPVTVIVVASAAELTDIPALDEAGLFALALLLAALGVAVARR